jgi:hypothetical protein
MHTIQLEIVNQRFLHAEISRFRSGVSQRHRALPHFGASLGQDAAPLAEHS